MYAFVLLQETGLTWSSVLRDIPHDAPAIVIYVLTAICGWAIWKGSRGNPERPGEQETAEPGDAGPRP